eukprot:14812243-Alexandrium_andersonii.AAC.1
MENLATKHSARRTSQSQHMKCSAILLPFHPFPHAKCPLSQRGARPSGNEVMKCQAQHAEMLRRWMHAVCTIEDEVQQQSAAYA